jgi:RHS repeat-associated protein
MIQSVTGFTGKERDAETGLDYFGARYFSGAQGRFTSPDPDNLGAVKSDPQSWNAYGYVRNNPLRFTDPLGLNYTICNAEGKECRDLTDKQYEQYLASIKNSNIYVTPGGTINFQNENGSVTKIGTATYYNEKGAERVEAAQAFLNAFILESAENALFQGGARAVFAGLSYGARPYRAARAGEEAIAATPVGRAGTLFNAAGNNSEQIIGGRLFSGHALDRMQERGFVPSMVEDIIANGVRSPGRYPGTTEIVGPNGRVIVGGKLLGVAGPEKVITVIPK